MSKNIEETNGNFLNATRRYFADVIGKYIEKDVGVHKYWRSDKGWEEILEFFDKRCIYCNEQMTNSKDIATTQNDEKEKKKNVKLQKEHLKSVSTGGITLKGNILPGCSVCNNQKGHTENWKDFLLKMAKPSREDAEKRIEKIKKYREKECNWSAVQKHSLYNNSEIILSSHWASLEDTAFSLLDFHLYHKDFSQYGYHITPSSVWEEAKKENYYPPSSLKGKQIIFSSEDGFAGAIHDSLEGTNNDDEVVIVSVNWDFLKKNVDYKSIFFSGERDVYNELINGIPLNNDNIIQISKPFKVNQDNEKVKENNIILARLKDIPWSLSHRGIVPSGAVFNIKFE